MAWIFLTLNCCMLFAILCLLGEVADCKQVAKRRDVHRIILKEKHRSRPKKNLRPSPHHNDFSREPFYDQIGEYSTYHNRHPTQFRPHNYYQNYPTRPADFNFHPHVETSANRHNHHVMDIEEFNRHQDNYGDNLKGGYNDKFPNDYGRYKQIMDHYNMKNEEQFRFKLENSKQQIPYAEESLSAMATNSFPMAWHQENADTFKGNWSPVSTLGTSLVTNSKIKEFPHQNIEEFIELTTSKPILRPSMIIEANFTKHRATNSNVNPLISTAYHLNHKYPKSKPGGGEAHSLKYWTKNGGSYQVHEESGDSVLGSFQNLAPAASTSSYVTVKKPEKSPNPNEGVFGLKTKARRTKRPAGSNK